MMRTEVGIRPRLLFLALAPLLTVVSVIGYYMISERIRDVHTALENRGKTIARHIASACEFGLFSSDTEILQRLARDSLQDQDIIYVGILNHSDDTVASTSRSRFTDTTDSWYDNQNDIIEFTAPVYTTGILQTEYDGTSGFQDDSAGNPEQQELLGRVIVRLSKIPTLMHQKQIIYTSLVILIVGLIISAIMALHMVGLITRPVLNLSRMVDKLTHGDLSARVQPGSVAELGRLEYGFNVMATRIEDGKARLEDQINNATIELQNTVNTLQLRNKELREARQIAVSAGEAKAEFLARMSHEIRTPVNAVIGFSQLLETTDSKESRNEYIQTINKAAEQLLSVIDSILNFSRLESGAVDIEGQPFELRDSLENVVKMLSNSAHEKGLELVLLIESDVPEKITGDSMKICQILTNLLANAIKYTSDGHVILKVRVVSGTEIGTTLQFSVTDSGIGIDEAQQDELFKPFSQIDSSITRRFGGTGLGLIISRMLARLMDGDIHLESIPGKGSTFSLTLPCVTVTEAQAPKPVLSAITSKVLVYDAHALSRRAIRNMLLSWSMEVFVTGSYEGVIGILSEQSVSSSRFQLLVLAAKQREAESAEFRLLIENALSIMPIPVLLLIGADNWSNPYSSREGQDIEWLAKPVRHKILHRKICQLLNVTSTTDIPEPETHRSKLTVPAGLHALVVEDNNFNLQMVDIILKRLGIVTTLADNGRKAIDAAKIRSYDFILMDIHMPDMDGIEVARNIRSQDNPNNNTPVIGLTADVFLNNKEEDTDAFINDYTYKPITIEKLSAVIHKWTNNPPGTSAARQRSVFRKQANVKEESAAAIPSTLGSSLVSELHSQLDELRMAVRNGNREKMHYHAHQLYGLCGYNEIMTLMNVAGEIHHSVNTNNDKALINNINSFKQELSVLEDSWNS